MFEVIKVKLIAYVSVNSNWVYHPPPRQPLGKFFEQVNPGHPGRFFCLISCPGAKNDHQIPRGGAKFSQSPSRVSTNLENMENLENSGNLKNCQNLREIFPFVEKPGKLRENVKYVT